MMDEYTVKRMGLTLAAQAEIKGMKAASLVIDHQQYGERCFDTKAEEIRNIISEGEMDKCKGMNCKAVDGVGHSVECLMDHNSKYYPNAGNNNPTYRHKGYKNEPLGNATEEQQAAWWEGRKASMFPPDHSIKNKKDTLIRELKADNKALRAELAALEAENAKLNSVVCQTCHGAGSVCSAPDDCYNCPACTATYNKSKADAIRDAKDVAVFSYKDFENGFDTAILAYDTHLDQYANKIEAES